MEQLTYERLQDNLKRLKLFTAVEILDSVADASQANGGSYLAFLDQLLEEEVAAKDKRRVSTAIKIAGLPMAKTIEEYDFTFHPHLDKKSVTPQGDTYKIIRFKQEGTSKRGQW